MREKGQTEAAKTLETPVFSRGIEILTEKVKFDYIKHHTVIAFPTPIFLQQVPTEIEYTITSQNSPDILSGKILVQTIEKED